ncbi:hypothetical protein [Verrucomicrobium sp. BvORR106]|uniref:hypothetical protein n=1 Tax=Verrucomicrobium sp. BvORR106 TaxID=1403819 RepID=UPI00224102D7|nr:hypothetical protein [Verrucomicrobium sp. BvORR106]
MKHHWTSRTSALLAALLLPLTLSAEPKKFSFDSEAWEEGEPPAEVFVVEGKFSIAAKDGNKGIQIGVGELVEANALLGDSARGSASIEAKVFASKQGRSFPRFAIGVHGQSGYRLTVFPAKKELQLIKQEEVVKSIPYTWTSDAWLKMKLEAKKVAEGKWTVTGKVWPATEAEPAEAQFMVEDTTLKGQGKCSIWGTPFSNTPILFDDVKVEVE